MAYMIKMKNDSALEHHGILGQKWGKRNGPPYPLDAEDHSAAEKKANSSFESAKEVKKTLTRKHRENITDYNERVRNEIKNRISEEEINEIVNALNKWNEAYDEYEEKTEKIRIDASRKAYNDTLNWYKNNDPGFLEDVYNQHGKNVDLFFIHDFRKMMEGYEDDHLQKDIPKDLEQKVENAYKEYINISKKYTESILNNYGDVKVSRNSGYKVEARSVVDNALDSIIWNITYEDKKDK